MRWERKLHSYKSPDVVSTLPTTRVSDKPGKVMSGRVLPAGPTQRHRRVLILEDEPSIRNVLCLLLAGVGCEGDVVHTDRQALAMIGRESFDAVLLDLRCCNGRAEQVVAQIRQIRPSLVGRVLIITGEVAGQKTFDMVERLCLPHVPRHRLLDEIWNHLRRVLGVFPS